MGLKCKCIIPESDEQCFVVRPSKRTSCPNGLARRYSTYYDPEHRLLKKYLSENAFVQMINSCNDSVNRLWPCPLSESIGYICCPVTCGLSFALPNLCLRDAEKALRNNVQYFNTYRLAQKGLRITFKKRCTKSWLEIRLTEEQQKLEKD